MTRILGIDPSLTGTGLALVDTTDRLVVDTWTVGTRPAGDEVARRLFRFDEIVGHIVCLDFDMAVIEGPSLGQQRQSGTFDRAGLWWSIVRRLDDARIPVTEVAPAARARYATGKGNASKDAVLLAVARRYPHVDVESNDEADALVLAAMGARHLGSPIDDVPKTHTAAMDSVRWSERAA